MTRNTTYNYNRLYNLLKTPKLKNEDKLSLEVGLERLSEGLPLTPTCLRIMARLEAEKVA